MNISSRISICCWRSRKVLAILVLALLSACVWRGHSLGKRTQWPFDRSLKKVLRRISSRQPNEHPARERTISLQTACLCYFDLPLPLYQRSTYLATNKNNYFSYSASIKRSDRKAIILSDTRVEKNSHRPRPRVRILQ